MITIANAYQKQKDAGFPVNKAWVNKNPEKRRKNSRNWARKNAKKVLANVRKYQLRLKLSSTIDLNDLKLIEDMYKRTGTKKILECYWTGRPIEAHKAHLDHIIPLSKGGCHHSSNLCYTTETLNKMKANKMPAEFVAYLMKLGIAIHERHR